MHPLGLCNNNDEEDLYEYGWVGVVKLEQPELDPKPCLTVLGKVSVRPWGGRTSNWCSLLSHFHSSSQSRLQGRAMQAQHSFPAESCEMRTKTYVSGSNLPPAAPWSFWAWTLIASACQPKSQLHLLSLCELKQVTFPPRVSVSYLWNGFYPQGEKFRNLSFGEFRKVVRLYMFYIK